MYNSLKSILYVDVSHTWASDLQTGMQKVVRQLCSQWSSDEFDCRLVIFQNGNYKVLPKDSLNTISFTYSGRNPNPLIRRIIWTKFKPLFRKILSKTPLNYRSGILMSSPTRKVNKFLNRIPPIEKSEELNAENINLLILELIFDQDHLNYVFELASKRNAKITFFSYDLIPINHSQYCPPEFSAKFRRYLEISRYSENLWSISNTTQRELEAYVGNSQQLKNSTYKWLPPSNYAICEHPIPFEGFNKNSSYWLFVSSFEPRKNHLGFFEALRILKGDGLKLPIIVMVGGSAWEDNPINKEIQKLIYDGFDLIKLINIEECCIGNLYQHANLTVYPSHFEGFGLPVVESLSYGIPVITSDVGSTSELLSVPGTLGFNQGDSGDLARKLRSFLRDENVQKSLILDAEAGKNNLGTWKEYAKELYYFSTQPSGNLS